VSAVDALITVMVDVRAASLDASRGEIKRIPGPRFPTRQASDETADSQVQDDADEEEAEQAPR